MALGPVPTGVAMPPKLAPMATPISSARRNGVSRAISEKSGRNAAIIIAAAAMFDIHIERAAVDATTSTKRTSRLPCESCIAICATCASSPYRVAATLKVNPPRKSASTGSADQLSTLAKRNSAPKGCKRSGVSAQNTTVGTYGGTTSLNQRVIQTAATNAARAWRGS